MSVTVRTKGLPLAQTLRFATSRTMREIGDLLSERIVLRTQGGQDARNLPFHPYSPGYVKVKTKYRGVAPGVVDLTLTGHMLNALAAVMVTEKSVRIGFRTARANRTALYHLGDGRVERDFFDVTDKEIEDARQRVAERMEM